MSLRHALDDYRRTSDSDRLFPGEFRTTAGLFSGTGERLVHVAPDGALRDYSYPLSGLSGVERSRFGVVFHDDGESERGEDETERADTEVKSDTASESDPTEVNWFDSPAEQRYRHGTVVETVHEVDGQTVVQLDHTDGCLHRTRFETEVSVTVYAYVEFAPDRVGHQRALLDHDDAVEAYHWREHDFLAVDASDHSLSGGVPPQLSELVADSPTTYPKERPVGRYEDRSLSGGVVVTATDDGTVGLATLLTHVGDDGCGAPTGEDTRREQALERVRSAARTTNGPLADRDDDASADGADAPLADGDLLSTVVSQDLRVLSLLNAPGGGRIAGPDFDPLYTSSGGYGYTWFRDDAEIARFLLAADDRPTADGVDDGGIGDALPSEWHDEAVRFYAATQLADGSWPHRTWPADGALAPGWANARLESGDAADYQADQTASVVSFLATYLRVGDPADPDLLRDTLARAIRSLWDTITDDGLPHTCQNAWENARGRFSHTAFTFLHAFAAVCRVADDPGLVERLPTLDERARTATNLLREGVDALWLPEDGRYALRLTDHGCKESAADPEGAVVDERADAASLAAASAFRELSSTADPPTDREIERLVTHVDRTIGRLYRETDAVRGLIRFEGDDWRQADQDDEKVWTVSTAWGAHASAELAGLLAAVDDDRAASHDAQARSLLAELVPGGSLLDDGGYLPEQVFDDGTPDCARPLGWSHALRTATVTQLAARGELAGTGSLAPTTLTVGEVDR